MKALLDEAPREWRAAEFINLVGKETFRSRAFANVAGKLPRNLVLGATRKRPMLFRVGRTFAVVFCVGVAAIEFAAAADLPYLQGPAPAYVPPSWAGFYLGGQVGYGMDSVRWRNLGASAFFSPPNSLTLDRGSGVIGGGQLGYNFQYNRLVLGIEGSVSAADFDRSFASPYFPATDVWSSRLTLAHHGDRPRRLRLRQLAALCQRRIRRRQRRD